MKNTFQNKNETILFKKKDRWLKQSNFILNGIEAGLYLDAEIKLSYGPSKNNLNGNKRLILRFINYYLSDC